MTTFEWVIVALGVSVAALAGFLWQLAHVRGTKGRARRRTVADASSQRVSDTRALSSSERRLYKDAQKLLEQKKYQAASRIYEQINMPREAIEVLEENGLIHEAAKILLRMQRPNRAGVIYARHAMWAEAAQCFRLANMPLEVGKCAREGGEYEVAAESFEKAGRFDEAAECYERSGSLLKSARLYKQCGNKPRSIDCYQRYLAQDLDTAARAVSKEEVDGFVQLLGDGFDSSMLVTFVAKMGRLPELILALASDNKVKRATQLLKNARVDVGPLLMADINFGEPKVALKVAEIFFAAEMFSYAGMVFERLNLFQQAAVAFEKAPDYERASYCYERAKQSAKAREMKALAHSSPHPKGSGQKGFALADITNNSRSGSGKEDESPFRNGADTTVLPIADSAHEQPARTPPPPPPPPPNIQSFAAESRQVETPDAPVATGGRFSLIESGGVDSASRLQSATGLEEQRKEERENRGEQNIEEQKNDDQTSASKAPPEIKDDAKPSAFAQEELSGMQASVTVAHEDEKPSNEETESASTEDSPQGVVQLDDGFTAFQRARFFSDLDQEQRMGLWRLGETIRFAEGETILTYNDEPRGIYVVLSGSVQCYRMATGTESYVDQIGPAESFGELWLLADQPTAVRFVAAEPCTLRMIEREPFNNLLDKDGAIARKLYKRFTMRLLKRLLRPQNLKKSSAAS